jgi:hypothetical protein
MMVGCGEFEFGVETRLTTGQQDANVIVTATQQIADNMVLVTVTPSATADTPTPTETATANETPTATTTAAPIETATPTTSAQATSRPSLPTATPVLPKIISFTAVNETVRPGGVVTVNWTAEGQSALLCLRFAGGYTDNCYEVSLSGSRTLAIEEDFRENILLDLHVSNSAGQESLSSIYIMLNCSDEYWFFDDPPENCPIDDAVDSYAAVQYFEKGWMLWIEETDTIYVFFEPQRTYSVFYSGFGDPEDPAAENDDYDPPEGYVVPKRGFGLVWGMYSYIRESLGWALEPEFGYDTTYQLSADPINGRLYALDPDGRLVILNTYLQTWSYR